MTLVTGNNANQNNSRTEHMWISGGIGTLAVGAEVAVTAVAGACLSPVAASVATVAAGIGTAMLVGGAVKSFFYALFTSDADFSVQEYNNQGGIGMASGLVGNVTTVAGAGLQLRNATQALTTYAVDETVHNRSITIQGTVRTLGVSLVSNAVTDDLRDQIGTVRGLPHIGSEAFVEYTGGATRQFADNVAARIGGNESRGLFDNVNQSGMVSGAMGAAFAVPQALRTMGPANTNSNNSSSVNSTNSDSNNTNALSPDRLWFDNWLSFYLDAAPIEGHRWHVRGHRDATMDQLYQLWVNGERLTLRISVDWIRDARVPTRDSILSQVQQTVVTPPPPPPPPAPAPAPAPAPVPASLPVVIRPVEPVRRPVQQPAQQADPVRPPVPQRAPTPQPAAVAQQPEPAEPRVILAERLNDDDDDDNAAYERANAAAQVDQVAAQALAEARARLIAIRQQGQDAFEVLDNYSDRSWSLINGDQVILEKIAKATRHIANLNQRAAATRRGKAGRVKKASITTQVTHHEERLAYLKAELTRNNQSYQDLRNAIYIPTMIRMEALRQEYNQLLERFPELQAVE